MKLKSVLFAVFFALFSNVFAANLHLNPAANNEDIKTVNKGISYPGFCQIEIINDSFSDVRVYGTFDDGESLGFNIYRYEAPHYISLFYGFGCHSGMFISVYSDFGTIYSGWTDVNSTIRVVPYLAKQAKAQVSVR